MGHDAGEAKLQNPVCEGAAWHDPERHVRVPIVVRPKGYGRVDKPVEVLLDLPGGVDLRSLRIVEIGGRGEIVDGDVPFQVDRAEGDRCSLVFVLKGSTPADGERRFFLYGGGPEHALPADRFSREVELAEGVDPFGQESYTIQTPSARYVYHVRGAGFASLIDRDGNDWISFRPWGGAAGNYRGIPNLVHPEGYFHPGEDGCTSRIVRSGPLKVAIESQSKDGEWLCRWEIYPRYATLTVLKAPRPYWFLYEGTPGGELDLDEDFLVRSTGGRTSAAERWEGGIPAPKWIYFGDAKQPRVLYLVSHEADDAVDSYWPMEGAMTVFGFGRLKLNKYLVGTPRRFTIGLCESTDADVVSREIDSAFREIEVVAGALGTKP